MVERNAVLIQAAFAEDEAPSNEAVSVIIMGRVVNEASVRYELLKISAKDAQPAL